MFSAYSFAQWGRPANCLFPMRRELSRHSEEAVWKPRERHFPKYTRKDMKVTGADPTRTCFAATLTDWRTPKGNGCKPLIVLLECGPRARVAEWQTQWTQNPPRAISCGFNSRPGHQANIAHATRANGYPDFAYFTRPANRACSTRSASNLWNRRPL